MSREWKPGDVAMVAGTADSAGVRAIWQGNQWATSTGRYLNHWQVAARPLVTIDPEDGEAVERLRDLIYKSSWDAGYGPEDDTPALQAALREFADPKPPKPEEPMGLGAVVEDALGRKWIAHEPDGGMGDNAFRWLEAGSTVGKMRRQFSDIDAVKVLSEGVR